MAVAIDTTADFVVHVILEEKVKDDSGKNRIQTSKGNSYSVSRAALLEHSPVVKAAMRPNTYKGSNSNEFTMHAQINRSVEIWLKIIHDADPGLDVSIEDVWRAILVCDVYNFAINLLYDWFAAWYNNKYGQYDFKGLVGDKNVVEVARKLLFPCWRLDHPRGFLDLSRYMVYSCASHITEFNPIDEISLHLPSRVIQQLNAARGRLKTVIFNPCYKPIKTMLQKRSQCCDNVACDYQRALIDTEAWPLEALGHKTAVKILLGRLRKFNYNVDRHQKSCISCNLHFHGIVWGTVSRAQGYFDGLCLDCMNASKTKTGDSDGDYWCHNDLDEDDIVYGCRVEKHGQPTWYFSFMGRREDRDRFRTSYTGVKKFGKSSAVPASPRNQGDENARPSPVVNLPSPQNS